MTAKSLRCLITAAVLALYHPGTPALACGFHGYVPPESKVERMLGSQQIVLARAGAANPFRFEVTEVLRGDGSAPAIPQLVDSVTRKRLAQRSENAVLFALDYEGKWQRLAFVDARFRTLLDQVLTRMQIWDFGGDEDRYQFFADRLNDPDPAVAALAYSELDAAPYDVLDRLRLDPDVPALLDRFFAPERAATIPIRTLLLGQSGDPRALAFMRERYGNGRRPTGPMAGAYALAWMELEGVPAADHLVSLLREGDYYDTVTRDTMLDALAIQAQTGEQSLRSAILGRVSTLVEHNPDFAAPVARQFGGRAVWDLAETLRSVAEADALASQMELYEVQGYLELASGQ